MLHLSYRCHSLTFYISFESPMTEINVAKMYIINKIAENTDTKCSCCVIAGNIIMYG